MLINSQLKSAIVTSLLGKYSLYVIQIASIAILSRLFSPEVFGVVAAAQVFVMFFQMLATSGLAPAVVYQEKVPPQMRDGVFTFTCILGVSLAILFLLLAEPLFTWFEFERGLVVFYTLAPCVLFSSLSMMPMASLQKDVKFLVIARAEIFAEIVSFFACIVASFYWDGISALALKFLLVPISRFVFYFLFCGNTAIGRPKIGAQIYQVKKLYGYAKYQIAFNILNFFSRNLDNILIAKYFGASTLGVYEKTYQVMKYPLQLFTFAITPALQPVLTKFKHQPDVVFNAYINVANKLAIVGLFSATVIYWNAHDIVFILFGNQWFESAPYLQVLALSIPIQMVLSSTGGVYQAFGATRSMFICGLFSSFVNVAAIVIGIYSNSLEILCYALVIAFTINYIQCFIVLYRNVFEKMPHTPGIALFATIVLVFVNLLLPFNASVSSESYIDSIISIGLTSLLAIIPCGLLFLVQRKMRKK